MRAESNSSPPVLGTHGQEMAGGADPVGSVCLRAPGSSGLGWVSLPVGAMRSWGSSFGNKCNRIYKIFAYKTQWPQVCSYVCVSISALNVDSSVPSFYIPFTRVNIFVFLFLIYFTLYNSRRRGGRNKLGEYHRNTDMTLCETDSWWKLAPWCRKLKSRLCDNAEESDGVRRGKVHEKGDVCVPIGWFMLMYGRNKHNIVKQLSSN